MGNTVSFIGVIINDTNYIVNSTCFLKKENQTLLQSFTLIKIGIVKLYRT